MFNALQFPPFLSARSMKATDPFFLQVDMNFTIKANTNHNHIQCHNSQETVCWLPIQDVLQSNKMSLSTVVFLLPVRSRFFFSSLSPSWYINSREKSSWTYLHPGVPSLLGYGVCFLFWVVFRGSVFIFSPSTCVLPKFIHQSPSVHPLQDFSFVVISVTEDIGKVAAQTEPAGHYWQ